MKIACLALIFSALSLTGCDADLFNSDCRAIEGSGFSLCRNQDGPTVFYLEPANQPPSGGGVLGGTVKLIGWSDKVILASREATFRGDKDGVMILDVASKKIEGPVDMSVIRRRYPLINLSNADGAWKALR